MGHAVEVVNLTKRFAGEAALDDVSFRVDAGEFVTLLGESGCGKTTTIRMIAGYLRQTAGRILIDDRDVSNVPAQKRDVGMVFQHYALFPHLTVRQNIAFGLKVRKRPAKEIRGRVDELLEMTDLVAAGDRKPHQLSGGMQQRVAVARALAFHPRILLMDEPLGALDAKLREGMQVQLKRLQREVGVTTIYVTHDQHEAMSMSDRLVVMSKGAVKQIGSPEEVYARPASLFVAEFVGASNVLHGTVVPGSREMVEARVGRATVVASASSGSPGAAVAFVLRPESVEVGEAASDGTGPNRFAATVASADFMGSWLRLTLHVPALDCELLAQVESQTRWRPGDAVDVSWPAEALVAVELGDHAAHPDASAATRTNVWSREGTEDASHGRSELHAHE
jgi:spermidine/putrescine ABC transporter ATP-binding subunit